MDFQVRGCGFISVTIVEVTFVTTLEQPLEVALAALIAALTTLKKLISVTAACIDQ